MILCANKELRQTLTYGGSAATEQFMIKDVILYATIRTSLKFLL